MGSRSGATPAPPAEEQTTLKVSRTLRERLRFIALVEQRSLYDVTESALTHYADQFEAISGLNTTPRIAKAADKGKTGT